MIARWQRRALLLGCALGPGQRPGLGPGHPALALAFTGLALGWHAAWLGLTVLLMRRVQRASGVAPPRRGGAWRAWWAECRAAPGCSPGGSPFAPTPSPTCGRPMPGAPGRAAGAWLPVQPRDLEPLAAAPACAGHSGRGRDAGAARGRAGHACAHAGGGGPAALAAHRARAAAGRPQHGRAGAAGLVARRRRAHAGGGLVTVGTPHQGTWMALWGHSASAPADAAGLGLAAATGRGRGAAARRRIRSARGAERLQPLRQHRVPDPGRRVARR
jgi:hypothetical protein